MAKPNLRTLGSRGIGEYEIMKIGNMIRSPHYSENVLDIGAFKSRNLHTLGHFNHVNLNFAGGAVLQAMSEYPALVGCYLFGFFPNLSRWTKKMVQVCSYLYSGSGS